jgi:hypothetical protein
LKRHRIQKGVSEVHVEGVPLWAATVVLLDIIVAALATWVGLRRAARSLFDARKAARISSLFAAVLVSWFVVAVLITLVPRPDDAPASLAAVVVLTWNLLLAAVGYGLRFFSETYRKVVDAIPHHLLLAFQSYRLIGIVFLPMLALGVLPAFFAVPAGVGDIIAGVGVLGAAYLYVKRSAGAWGVAVGANLIGVLDFAVALGAGTRVLAPPLQTILGGSPALTSPLSVFPLGLIPLFVVPLGFIVHFHSLTRLAGERNRTTKPGVPHR